MMEKIILSIATMQTSSGQEKKKNQLLLSHSEPSHTTLIIYNIDIKIDRVGKML